MQLTNQEIFDKAAVGILKQGVRSEGGDGRRAVRCAYRGDGGLKCAAGHVMLDEHYNKDFEGAGVCLPSNTGLDCDPAVKAKRDQVVAALKASGVETDDQFRLVRELQVVHDQEAPMHWHDHLCGVAARYGLSTAAIDGLL
jgi:hypothetical protein